MLEKKYTLYREKKISGLRIHFEDIKPLIATLSPEIFTTRVLGYSEGGIPIYSIRIGSGLKKIVLWSQMHGDESTATKSFFDIFKYFQGEYSTQMVQDLLKAYTLIFVPMLNPDGAFAYTRVNALGIDLNRDAVQLQSKEATLLFNLIQQIKPDFAFNLHDQTSFYSVSGTSESAVMSFLSPSANEARDITPARSKAMRLIASMFLNLQAYIPNQIGRYQDGFNINCFGDTFQKMQIPTILIESGYYPGDEEREMTRKFHFIALLSALFAISKGELAEESIYFTIPMNKKNFYDVCYTNVSYKAAITQVGVRFLYHFKDHILHRSIDYDSLLVGNDCKEVLFHKLIDAKAAELSSFS